MESDSSDLGIKTIFNKKNIVIPYKAIQTISILTALLYTLHQVHE